MGQYMNWQKVKLYTDLKHYSYAQDIVARGIARSSPKSVQYVSKLMDDLLKKGSLSDLMIQH